MKLFSLNKVRNKFQTARENIILDIDLQVFLTLSEQDLKEIGINLFGPRRKLANCISRYGLQIIIIYCFFRIQEGLKTKINGVEQVYADRLQAKRENKPISTHYI